VTGILKSPRFWGGVAAGYVVALVLTHPSVQGRQPPKLTGWTWVHGSGR
jgi:hypothetical protein